MLHPFWILPNLFFIFLFFCFSSIASASDLNVIVIDELKPSQFSKFVPSIKNELKQIWTEGPLPQLKVSHFSRSSSFSPKEKRFLKEVLSDRKYDLVLILKPIPSKDYQDLGGKRGRLFAPFLLNHKSWLTDQIENDLKSFHSLIPVKSISILAPSIYDSYFKTVGRSLPFRVETIRTTKNSLEAVYIPPLTHLSRDKLSSLVQDLHQRKIPIFSSLSKDFLKKGVIAGNFSTAETEWANSLSRKIAIALHEYALGFSDSFKSVTTPTQLEISQTGFQELGLQIPPKFFIHSTLQAQTTSAPQGSITLETVMTEAIHANLDLEAAEHERLSQEERIALARAPLLPQIHANLIGNQLNAEATKELLGFIPQRGLFGILTASQTLFSERAISNFSIAKKASSISEQETRKTRLDTALQAAILYLDLLETHRLIRLRSENLKRTQVNLLSARSENRAGSTYVGDVYRWQSEVARASDELIQSQTQSKILTFSLNQMMRHPLENPLSPVELDEAQTSFWIEKPEITRALEKEPLYLELEAYLIHYAKNASPDLTQATLEVQLQESSKDSAHRSIFLPTLDAYASAFHFFGKSGYGSEPQTFSFPQFPDNFWTFGLNLSFNLFSGGGELAHYRQQAEQWKKAEAKRFSSVNQVQHAIKSSLENVRRTHLSSALQKEAAESAQKGYELVKRSYDRGTQPITALIDAQNNAFSAKVAFQNSRYEFLKSFFQLERALGEFEILSSKTDQTRFLDQLQKNLGKKQNELSKNSHYRR